MHGSWGRKQPQRALTRASEPVDKQTIRPPEDPGEQHYSPPPAGSAIRLEQGRYHSGELDSRQYNPAIQPGQAQREHSREPEGEAEVVSLNGGPPAGRGAMNARRTRQRSRS